MKYIKKFNSIEEYNTFLDSADYVIPNVCQVGSDIIKYNPLPVPLYVEAIEDLTVIFSGNAIQYSLDNNTWVDLPADTATPTIIAGTKVYFKANIKSISSASGIGTFKISGNSNVGGNPKSLLHGDVATYKGDLSNYCFYQLFRNNSKIIDASALELTSSSLKEYCYAYMFERCTSLVTAPELPATKLGYRCYASMFSECSSLINAPQLPATNLATDCYQKMFYKCTSLINAPQLPAVELAQGCYTAMFYRCESLVSAPALPATTLKSQCYGSSTHGGMFAYCISLVNAPELPATFLQNQCYHQMFFGCSNLKYIKAMFTTTPSTSYTNSWLSGVAATGTFVKNAEATWDVTGVNGIPEGWTVETATE